MSKILKCAEQVFQKRGMYVENPDKTAITVSNDVDSLPFMYLIHNKKEFEGFILCLAVDYIDAHEIAQLALDLFMIAPVIIGEKFYISPDGATYWSDEAEVAFTLDNLDVSKLEGPSKLWN